MFLKQEKPEMMMIFKEKKLWFKRKIIEASFFILREKNAFFTLKGGRPSPPPLIASA